MLKRVWRLLISLKFAVVIMVLMTAGMMAATFVESGYDTPTAQYYVYQSPWFYGLLVLFGVNILCVALSRLPWQTKHIPFLLAHLGILLLLYGSWMTMKFGVDGIMPVTEGSTESAVELTDSLFLVNEGELVDTYEIRWRPPMAKFPPIRIPKYGIEIVDWMTHAEPTVEFPAALPAEGGVPALRVKLQGDASSPPFMRVGQEFWLWAGDPSFSDVRAGGARLLLSPASAKTPPLPEGAAVLAFRAGDGKLSFQARNSAGKLARGEFPYARGADLVGKVVDPGWKFGVKATILEFVPAAKSELKYKPAAIQFGQNAPAAAIKVQALAKPADGGERASIWLGLGERANLRTGGRTFRLGFYPRRLTLPFGVELRKFQIDRYQGTANPMEFSSRVNVKNNDPKAPNDLLISMNEPMKYGGYTFYQSSYIDAQPRPVTSVFSVNQDPGRWLKYLGSILLVVGSIALFAVKYLKKKKVTS